MQHALPMPGDIGITQISGNAGRLIRIGQWLNGNGFADYQHAFLVLPDGMLIEAEPGGATIRPLSVYDGANILYVCPEGLTDRQRDAICAAGRRYEGVPYSFLDYLAIAVHRLRIPFPGLRRYVAATGHMICSQLVDQSYHDAGIPLFSDGRWPGYVTPGALFQRLADF
ncbi:hypothetical protein ADL21_33665 [Streptomyces albus subsp. albus]|nr:hypothetical protein ADL21_33665 [Streptomyces albus subsp. albus]